MRLRQEFHTRHRTLKVRGAAVVMRLGAGWRSRSDWRGELVELAHRANRRSNRKAQRDSTKAGMRQTSAPAAGNTGSGDNSASDASTDATLIADNDAEDFTLLPGSMPQETGDAAVVRVRMQRGALGALGLPVNEDRANEWIQVDLFVGQDGQPQAVRLPAGVDRPRRAVVKTN